MFIIIRNARIKLKEGDINIILPFLNLSLSVVNLSLSIMLHSIYLLLLSIFSLTVFIITAELIPKPIKRFLWRREYRRRHK